MSPTSEEDRKPESPKPNWFRNLFSWVPSASTFYPFTQAPATYEPPQSSTDLTQIEGHVHDYLQDQNEILDSYLLHSDTEEALVTTTNPVTANPLKPSDTEAQSKLVATDSIPPYPPLQLSLLEHLASSPFSSFSSSSAIFDLEESIPSVPHSPNYYQILITAPVDVYQLPAIEDDSALSWPVSSKESFPYRASAPTTKVSPNSSNLKTEKSQLPEGRVPKRREPEAEPHHPVVETIDRQELGRHILVLAIPMLMGLITTYNYTLSLNTGMLVVAVTLSFAFAAILNGVLLRNSYPTASIVILVAGLALMLFAFFAFVGWLLPIKLAAIPAVAFLVSLFPFCKVIGALICREKVKDLEMGEIEEPIQLLE